jgi:uncharacterized membrane protein YccC
MFFHVPDPTWALISGIICTELDMNRAKNIVIKRTLLTILGVIVALAILLILGPGLSTLFVGVAVITLIFHYIIPLGDDWKFTTATAIVVLVVATQQHSLASAEIMGFKRAVEVSAGSITAGIVSIISSSLFKFIKK